MRNLIQAIMIPAVCLTLAADSTGRITGKVTTSDGKPVANASINLTRADINWAKDLKVSDKGTFMQVGLEPKDYKVTVSAPGLQTYVEDIHIPLGEALTRNFVLKTPQEATAEAIKNGAAKPADATMDTKATSGAAAYNTGIEFYNQQKFAEALPFLEKAAKDLREGVATMPEGEDKKAMEAQVPVGERVYGLALYSVAKSDAASADLALKAEPFLVTANARDPKDQRVLVALLEIAKQKQDAVATKKYQDALDLLIGPRPEASYNDGVTAYKENRFQDTKDCVNKAIALDPKFADAYYLLGMADVNLGDLKGAKEAFKKYIEVAPTGKHAAEAKEVIKELK